MCATALERVLDRALQRRREAALSVGGGVLAGGEPVRRISRRAAGDGLGPGGGAVAPRVPPLTKRDRATDLPRDSTPEATLLTALAGIPDPGASFVQVFSFF